MANHRAWVSSSRKQDLSHLWSLWDSVLNVQLGLWGRVTEKVNGVKKHYVAKNVRHRDLLTVLKREKPWHNLARSIFGSNPPTTSSVSYRCRSCTSVRSTIGISFSKVELTRYHTVITASFESLCTRFVHTENVLWRRRVFIRVIYVSYQASYILSTTYTIKRHVMESLVLYILYISRDAIWTLHVRMM